MVALPRRLFAIEKNMSNLFLVSYVLRQQINRQISNSSSRVPMGWHPSSQTTTCKSKKKSKSKSKNSIIYHLYRGQGTSTCWHRRSLKTSLKSIRLLKTIVDRSSRKYQTLLSASHQTLVTRSEIKLTSCV